MRKGVRFTKNLIDEKLDSSIKKYHSFFDSINPSKKYNTIIKWDDVVQFTSMGFIKLCEEIYKKKISFTFRDFLGRDQPNGLEFVMSYLVEKEKLPKEELFQYYKQYYKQILEFSPTNQLWRALKNCGPIIDKCTIVFSIPFEGMNNLLTDLEDTVFQPKSLKFIFSYGENFFSIVEDQINKKNKYTMYWGEEVPYLLNVFENKKIYETVLLVPFLHNGLDQKTMELFLRKSTEDIGPLNTKLFFIPEELI